MIDLLGEYFIIVMQQRNRTLAFGNNKITSYG
jgi:hypothetical protein